MKIVLRKTLPREGTETISFISLNLNLISIKKDITPRGDGNFVSFYFHIDGVCIKKDITPRGDGNEFILSYAEIEAELRKTLPREGTETDIFSSHLL